MIFKRNRLASTPQTLFRPNLHWKYMLSEYTTRWRNYLANLNIYPVFVIKYVSNKFDNIYVKNKSYGYFISNNLLT